MQYLLAPRLFDGDRFHDNMAVAIADGRIAGLLAGQDLPEDANCLRYSTGTLAPGFVDLQVNGGGGVLLNNDPSTQAVERILDGHRSAGTTALLPTLLSDTPQRQRQAVDAVMAARAQGRAGVLGVHLEGPFFDTGRRGTHRADAIRPLEDADIDWLVAIDDLPVLLTLAPEHARPGQIRRLVDAGIRVWAGHSNATYDQVQLALDEGLSGFTHLFNAMSPLAGRAPGMVGAALDSELSWVSVIADGHHVHPASIRIAHRARPGGRLVLVSDSMSTVGSDSREVELYGERIALRDGRLVNAEGALAGSAIGLNDAVRYCHRTVGLPLEECLRMASRYPASCLALEGELGRIAPGYRADLVLLDDDFGVMATWVDGAGQP